MRRNITQDILIKDAFLCLSMSASALVSLSSASCLSCLSPFHQYQILKTLTLNNYHYPINKNWDQTTLSLELPINYGNWCALIWTASNVKHIVWLSFDQMNKVSSAVFQCQLVRPVCKTCLILHFFVICTIQDTRSKPMMPISNSTTDHSRLHKYLLFDVSHHTNFIFSVSLSSYSKV